MTAVGSTNDRVSFPIYDGHGNTIATLPRTGTGYAVANEKHYDAWCKTRFDSGAARSGQILNPNIRYRGSLGHKCDSTSGMVYSAHFVMRPKRGASLAQTHAGIAQIGIHKVATTQ